MWPWDVAPLTGRLVGVWLGAFAIAYVWALWDGDWRPGAPALPRGADHRAAARARPARRTRGDVRPVGRRGARRLLRARARWSPRPASACSSDRARPPRGGWRRADERAAGGDSTRPMTPGVRAGLVAIASVIFWLGLSLFVFPTHTDDLFAWTIQPPMTAAFLGASYWASTTLAAACASERDWARGPRVRGAVLRRRVVLLVVTFVHIDRFHMDSATGWLWLTLYAIFPPSVLAPARPPAPHARDRAARRPRDPAGDPGADRPAGRRHGRRSAPRCRRAGRRRVAVALAAHAADRPRDRRRSCCAGGPRAHGLPRARLGPRAPGDAAERSCSARCSWSRSLRFSDTLDWDTAGAWIYLGFVVSLLAVGALRHAARGDEPPAVRPRHERRHRSLIRRRG